MEYLQTFYATPEYQNYLDTLKCLKAECESIGHVVGDYLNNGFGWTSKECKYCDSQYDIKSIYGEEECMTESN